MILDITGRIIISVVDTRPEGPDVVLPRFKHAYVVPASPTNVIVQWSEKITAVGDDYTTGVTIKKNTAAQTINTGTRSDTQGRVTYVLAASAVGDDVLTIEYNGAGALKDLAGNSLASFGPEPIVNQIPEAIPPTFVEGEIGAHGLSIVVLRLSEPVKSDGGAVHDGFVIKRNGGNVGVSNGRIHDFSSAELIIDVDVNAADGDAWQVQYTAASGHITDLVGNALGNISLTAIANNATDITKPTLASAEIGVVDASTIEAVYSEVIAATGNDFLSGHFATVAGSSRAISSATRQADQTKIRFVLASPVTPGQAVTLSYDANLGFLKDQATAPNFMATYAPFAVTNRLVGDITPPVYVASEIGLLADDKVVVTFDELIVSPGADYKAGSTVKVNDTPVTINSGARGTDQSRLELTLASSVLSTDTVTWEYDSGPGDLTDQAVSPNALATVTPKTVQNNVAGDVTPPAYVSSEIGAVSDSKLVVTLHEPIVSPGGNYALGSTIKKNGTATTISSANRHPTQQNKIEFMITPAGLSTDTFTWEYDSGPGDITDQAGSPNALATTAAQAVTNNIIFRTPPVLSSVTVTDADKDLLVGQFSKAIVSGTPNYKLGFTATKNDIPAPILSGARQGDQSIIHWGIGAEVRAFPGAQGFGTQTRGGFIPGFTLYRVTSASGSGAGTLKAAIDAHNAGSTPGVVTFTTGGTIDLPGDQIITKPNLTICGETAPGGGVCLRRYTIYPAAPNIVIRYLRERPSTGGSAYANGWYPSCVTISTQFGTTDLYNIVIDHCSLTWAINEGFDTWIPNGISRNIHDITVSNCIIAETLRTAGHAQSPHSNGAYLARRSPTDIITSRLSFHHNAMAHLGDVLLKVDGAEQVEIINNVFYHWGTVPLALTGQTKVHIINNYFKQKTGEGADYEILLDSAIGSGATARVFASGNRVDDPDFSPNVQNARKSDPTGHGFEPAKFFTESGITVQSAEDAYTYVLANAGARLPSLDAADTRIINDITNRTGGFISDPATVGGYPTLAAGTPPTDTDQDGMSDAYEDANGLNKNSAADNDDVSASLYLNLEKYLHTLTGDTQSADLKSTDVVKLSYDSVVGDITDQDTPANDLASIMQQVVTNSITPDPAAQPPAPPAYVASEIGQVSATKVVVTLSKPIYSPGGNYVLGSTVKRNGNTVTISSASRNVADHNKLEINLASSMLSTDTITWEYSSATGDIVDQEIVPLELASVTPKTVTNNIAADTTPPTYASSEVGAVSATKLVVTLSEPINSPGGNYALGSTVRVGGSPVTVSSGARNATSQNKLELTLAVAIVSTDVVTWEYSSTTGDITDQAGTPNELATTSAQAVTNNVLPGPGPGFPQFVSAEVGQVSNVKVVGTFSETIFSQTNDYKSGFTIRDSGGNVKTISTASRRAAPNEHQIEWNMSAPLVYGTAYTMEYDDTVGNITDLPGSGGVPSRIMFLGDSFTQLDWQGGHRFQIAKKLIDAGFSSTFIGRFRTDTSNGAIQVGRYAGTQLPAGYYQNEGVNSSLIAPPSGSSPNWQTNWPIALAHANNNPPPSLIVIQIGTNDAVFNKSAATINADISAFLDQIWNSLPNVRIVLMDFPRVAPGFSNGPGSAAINAVAAAYRALIPNTVAAKQAAGRQISYVSIYDTMNNSTGSGGHLTGDNVHPSVLGYEVGISDPLYPAIIAGGSGTPNDLLTFSPQTITNNLQPVPSPPTSFVTVNRQTAQFWLNGGPFYFGGSALYRLHEQGVLRGLYDEDGNVVSWTTMNGCLDKIVARGGTVVRTWCFNFGDYSSNTWGGNDYGVDARMWSRVGGVNNFRDASFRIMDRVIDECRQRGLRLILTLSNHWQDYGGMHAICNWAGISPGGGWGVSAAAYTNANVRTIFKQYINYVLNRTNTWGSSAGIKYKDDPTIMMWEPVGEARASGPNGDALYDFYTDICGYIKSIDPNHLIGTGEDGFDIPAHTGLYGSYNNPWVIGGFGDPGMGTSYARNVTISSVDAGSCHLYGTGYWGGVNDAGIANDQLDWIQDHTNIAAAQGKPSYIGECGEDTDGGKKWLYEARWDKCVSSGMGGACHWMHVIQGHSSELSQGVIFDGRNATETAHAQTLEDHLYRPMSAKSQPQIPGGGADETDPAVDITSPAPATVFGHAGITVTGTASDNIAVTSVRARVGTGDWILATGTTAWSVNLALTIDGNNTITVEAYDAAGNFATDTVVVEYDPVESIVPTVSISTPTPSQVFTTQSINVTGVAADNVQVYQVHIRLNGGSWLLCTGTTSWSYTGLSLNQAGSNTIEARATDTNGNVSTLASVSVTYTDQTIPTVAITSHTDEQSVTEPGITLSGTAADNIALSSVEVNLNGAGWVAATGTTSWSKALTLVDGSNTIDVRSKDNSNNYSATAHIDVIFNDTVIPTVTITSHTDEQVVTSVPISLAGTAADNVGVTLVEVNLNSGGWAAVDSGTTSWSKSLTLNSGSNTIDVRSKDAKGNFSNTAHIDVTYTPPPSTETIYKEGTALNNAVRTWTHESFSMTVTFNSTDQASEGTHSIKCVPSAWGMFRFAQWSGTLVQPEQWTGIRFKIYTTVTTQMRATVEKVGGTPQTTKTWNPTASTWTQVNFVFADQGLIDPEEMEAFNIGWNTSATTTFYIDELELY